jgi:demethylmacrocin O-methyltransferase
VSANDTSLDTLALRYGADKSSRVHGYTRAYERHFAPLRDRPIALLEIGVGSGASLRLWRDYFPHATVYGLDVAGGGSLELPGVRVFRGDQGDRATLERLVADTGPLDIVIDDGGHLWAQQILSFKTLYPHLKPGGYYVVEDLHTSYWERYKSGGERTLWFLRDLVHELNLHGRSGYGTPANDPDYPSLRGELNAYQRTLGSITFSKSIAFAQKRDADEP